MSKKPTKCKEVLPDCIAYGVEAMETFINWYELRSVTIYAQAMAKMLQEAVVVYKRTDRAYYQVCRACVWPDRLMDVRTKGYGLDYACGHIPENNGEHNA